jgi:hypothetical protein
LPPTVAAADHILLFENPNSESALRQEHGCREPARSRSDYDDAPALAALAVITHSPTLGEEEKEMD